MDDAQDHRPETRPNTGGVARDLQRLKTEGTATVAELREFIGQLRGRSPQEMLGLVAKSGLTRNILLATFLLAVLLVALTIVPYYWYGPPAHAQGPAADETTATQDDPATGAESDVANEAPDGAPPAAAEDTVNNELDPERAVDAMGINETRISDPDTNPLEDKLDKLLDGVE